MIQELWNIGPTVENLDREFNFFESVGSTLILHEKFPVGTKELEYAKTGEVIQELTGPNAAA
jgi:hypothetical protein